MNFEPSLAQGDSQYRPMIPDSDEVALGQKRKLSAAGQESLCESNENTNSCCNFEFILNYIGGLFNPNVSSSIETETTSLRPHEVSFTKEIIPEKSQEVILTKELVKAQNVNRLLNNRIKSNHRRIAQLSESIAALNQFHEFVKEYYPIVLDQYFIHSTLNKYRG